MYWSFMPVVLCVTLFFPKDKNAVLGLAIIIRKKKRKEIEHVLSLSAGNHMLLFFTRTCFLPRPLWLLA
uniref:Uncharacterized protein n=1 Tax=Arundo donax TaxID=35708 RepID=A0A0A9HR61_ARUDO